MRDDNTVKMSQLSVTTIIVLRNTTDSSFYHCFNRAIISKSDTTKNKSRLDLDENFYIMDRSIDRQIQKLIGDTSSIPRLDVILVSIPVS